MINRFLCCAMLSLSSAAVYAVPSVSGNTISWPDDGWYQVQRSSDYSSLSGQNIGLHVMCASVNICAKSLNNQRYMMNVSTCPKPLR
jgi:hypothetical protein